MDTLDHIFFDIFNVLRYIVDNISTFFSILFVPLQWIFNFLKGFFVGINSAPPATAISWVFPTNIMAIFNAIPYFSVLTSAVASALGILILVFIFRRFVEF